jgi:hypothetical protein
VEIASGVHAGEQIIVSDRSALKPGEQVKTKPVQEIAYDANAQEQ